MTTQDNYLERPQHHIGIVDAVFLAVVAAGGYLIAGNFGDNAAAFAGQAQASNVATQQICSDEELRQMRGAPETCFAPVAPDKHEFSLEPSLQEKGSYTRNAGRQAPAK